MKRNRRLNMNKFAPGAVAGFSILAVLLTTQSVTMAASYKCKGTDGKIEYSDRPCDTSKEEVSAPKAAGGVVSTPTIAPMRRLETLFADYEPRLCERERLANEIDMAQRTGELKQADARWKLRQERLSALNDNLIEFQDKAAKVTKGSASDSPEMMAVRNFQRKLKTCGVLKK
jgi:hypothetical protein